MNAIHEDNTPYSSTCSTSSSESDNCSNNGKFCGSGYGHSTL